MTDMKVDETQRSIRYLVEQVAHRGWNDEPRDFDDFEELRREERYRNAIVAALYEEYFEPERHETEWQVLADIIGAVVASPSAQFVTGAVIGGILGNSAYDLLKQLCLYASSQFKKELGGSAGQRADGFLQIAHDSETIAKFFRSHSKARAAAVEEATNGT